MLLNILLERRISRIDYEWRKLTKAIRALICCDIFSEIKPQWLMRFSRWVNWVTRSIVSLRINNSGTYPVQSWSNVLHLWFNHSRHHHHLCSNLDTQTGWSLFLVWKYCNFLGLLYPILLRSLNDVSHDRLQWPRYTHSLSSHITNEIKTHDWRNEILLWICWWYISYL